MDYVFATAQKNINVDILQKLIVPLLPKSQQTQIVEEIESRFAGSEAREKAIDESLTKSETLRQSILKQAFSGKLIMKNKESMESKGEVLIYKTQEGKSELEVKLKDDTVWLSQRQMSGLFQKDTDTIGLHIRNIYKEKELPKNSTTEYFPVVQKEGKREVLRKIQYHNLDVIISVGYRVK